MKITKRTITDIKNTTAFFYNELTYVDINEAGIPLRKCRTTR